MKVVLGVDAAGRYLVAVWLLARLRFADISVEAVHVVNTSPILFAEHATMPGVIEELCAAAADITQSGAMSAALRREGTLKVTSEYSRGSVAATLMERADAANADLIAVGSAEKGALRAFFTGSVGRGLMTAARQSLLVAKEGDVSFGPIRAVLATDHSAYGNACIEKLLTLKPTNIAHLTVLTVYHKDWLQNLRAYMPDAVLDPVAWMKRGLEDRNQNVIERLRPLGCRFDSCVRDGDVNTVIKDTMRNVQADLLILGAQGHGFLERLTLGSVSFHQIAAEPYPVLTLRVPPEAVLPCSTAGNT